jgi:hypothetical protein
MGRSSGWNCVDRITEPVPNERGRLSAGFGLRSRHVADGIVVAAGASNVPREDLAVATGANGTQDGVSLTVASKPSRIMTNAARRTL